MTDNINHQKNNHHWETILNSSLDDTSFVIFDLETTGGNPEKSGLTEIFALEFTPKKKMQKSFYTLINPERKIPPIVRKITQITNEMVKNAPPALDIMPDFLNFIEGKVLVSHNTPCDFKFLDYYSKIIDKKPLDNFFLCTHLLSSKLIPESKAKSLKGLSEFIGTKETPNHRAKEDTLCTLELFKNLLTRIKNTKVQTVRDAIKFQGDLISAIKLGWGVPKKDIRNIPSTLGVVKFNKNKTETLFALASENCKQAYTKVEDLASLPKTLARSLVKADQIIFVKHKNILDAKIEANLISLSKKSCFNPNKIIPSYVLGLSISKKNKTSFEVSLSHIKEKNSYFYGPFSDSKKALDLLFFLAKDVFSTRVLKDKFYVDQEGLSLLLTILNKQKLLYSIYSMKKYLVTFKLSNYLKAFQDFSTLSKDYSLKSLQNLRETSGLLFLEESSHNSNWSVYSVIKGIIHESLTIDQFYVTWLSTGEGCQFINKFLTESSQTPYSITKALNKEEAMTMNTVFWSIYIEASKKNEHKTSYLQEKDLIKYK